MASTVNYKFRSYKNFSKINFEGQSLSLWELKYEIISVRRMNSKDFDLLFYDADTEERFEDEYTKIPNNSRILVDRIPLHMSNNKNTTEFKQKMQGYSRVPPENYICYRCGTKGHYIQHCPTNDDKNYNNLIMKVPSGIPKEFLNKDESAFSTRPQYQEWKKQTNLLRKDSIPENLKCSECNGLLFEAQISSCKHFFCSGCAHIEERCSRCRKMILFLKPAENKQKEVKEYTERGG
ncbi:hypothetical protein NUSPORA_01832 [Nucleospora cyclopteri]